jgi:hypothetical protein
MVEACRIREAEVWNKHGISMDVAWNKTCGVRNVSTRWLRGLIGGKIVTMPVPMPSFLAFFSFFSMLVDSLYMLISKIFVKK